MKITISEYFLNKVVEMQSETLLKKKLRHRCFPVDFVIFFRTRTAFLWNTCERLLCFLKSDCFPNCVKTARYEVRKQDF